MTFSAKSRLTRSVHMPGEKWLGATIGMLFHRTICRMSRPGTFLRLKSASFSSTSSPSGAGLWRWYTGVLEAGGWRSILLKVFFCTSCMSPASMSPNKITTVSYRCKRLVCISHSCMATFHTHGRPAPGKDSASGFLAEK